MASFYNPRRPLSGLLLFFVAAFTAVSVGADDKKNYIVYLGDLPDITGIVGLESDLSLSLPSIHAQMLQQVLEPSINTMSSLHVEDFLVHSFLKSFNGFVARMTEAEAQRMTEMDGVVSVFVSRKKKLHTTRSWDFLGLPENVERSTQESDIIVGVFDTGAWPESASFDDKGLGPPPAKWKGICQSSNNFTCNNKLIGARSYRMNGKHPIEDDPSPRDTDGHGTHTASTVAGQSVAAASLYGIGEGTARGAVPSARIAIYKICWSDSCYEEDILAAFDDAIADGVDLISLSVGEENGKDYFKDSIAIGAFHSMKNGVLTSNSGGNSGPSAYTVDNCSPWSLTVAASSTDRKFVTSLQLGNNDTFEGIFINTFLPPNQPKALIYGGDAPNKTAGFNSSISRFCLLNSMDATLVKDKIIFCDNVGEGIPQELAGAAGTVMRGTFPRDASYITTIPASYVTLEDGAEVANYINSTKNPTALISKTTSIKEGQAPVVASFSSRGPNPITADILKPDLTAPGVDILAAWPDETRITMAPWDKRRTSYSILSGTSMSCPHATGAAAYVKSFNPTWTPAAIKSALMTTATPMSSKYNEDAEFAYGAGQINPLKAIDPGLIYHAGVSDYINFLCGQNYTQRTLQLVTRDHSICSNSSINSTVWNLNYPSLTLSAPSGSSITREFLRRVTNVGSANSTYKAVVNAPSGMKITVEPSVLTFRTTGQKKRFVVTVEAVIVSGVSSGSLVWDDGVHQVRSPVVAYPRSNPSSPPSAPSPASAPSPSSAPSAPSPSGAPSPSSALSA